MTAGALHLHAQALLRDELKRRRGLLGRLPADRRVAVEQLAARTVAAAVDALLEQARRDARIAAALAASD
jgi:hypothetical protein